MTPEQALQSLDNAASLAPLTRKDHIALQQCSEMLKAFIESAREMQKSTNTEEPIARDSEPSQNISKFEKK